jgi:hypothetical protein
MTRINDNGIDREMTASEQAAYDAFVQDEAKRMAAEIAALEALTAAKASARAKLKALGLTDAEIAALVG